MVIEQAGAQTLGLAVDNAEHFHLFTLGEANEAHERQRNRQIAQMSESMLAINLGHDFSGVGVDLQPNLAFFGFDKPPAAFGLRP